MAQSIKENNVQTKLYAVDTWAGDAQAGYYDNSVYESVTKTKEIYYKQQDITLLRMYFSEALTQFKPKSVDVLHIDGFHDYDAVKEDFTTWRNRVKDDGIILLHDVGTGCGYGSEKFWNELQAEYEFTMLFDYSWGLGVICLSKERYEQLIKLVDSKNYIAEENRRQEVLNDQLAKLYYKNIDLNKYIVDLEEWNKQKDGYLQGWEEVVAGKDSYIEELQKQLIDYKKAVDEESKVIEQVRLEISNMTKVIEGKEQYITRLQDEKQVLDQEIEGWESVVADKENYITQLQEEKQVLNQEIKGWENVVTDKESYITQLREEKQVLNQEIDSWRETTIQKDQYIDELEAIRADLQAQLEASKQEINRHKSIGEILQKEKDELLNAPISKKIKLLFGGKKP